MKPTITPERTAHFYALMAWNPDMTEEQAKEIAYTQKYEELDGISYAETSIIAAIKGIKEKILVDKTVSENIDWPAIKLEPEEKVFDKIMQILEEIHNKWVLENAKKHKRKTEQQSLDNLFQHLPTALIGIDELCKDLMFLAPFLAEMGIDCGQMEFGEHRQFKPSAEIEKAYARYIQKYKEENEITSVETLDSHIKGCVYGDFKPLAPTSDMAKARLAYMREHIELLSNTVMQKNEEEFGKLPPHSFDV